ncbi:MAG: hypothetical protein WDW36_000011 [Sanguina aurantia]
MVSYTCDGSTAVIVSNCNRRGWEQLDEGDENFDVYFASVSHLKYVFGSDMRLGPTQRINHFPNHFELTRKDLLCKNIKRHQQLAKRGGGAAAAAQLDILPETFVLPHEHALFVEAFRKEGGLGTWIMKPTGSSQGKGIFLINKLSQVRQWSNSSLPPALRNASSNYIVSRYIKDPLLISGKKFDLRLYVLVTSFKPLKVYLSDLGFARFCTVQYTTQELDNEFVHLTNVAIQKTGDAYNSKHGNKWTLQNLRLYLEASQGDEATEKLFGDIERVITLSLQACQAIVTSDRHCFELYGYDIMIDSALKPWLIEVNASPSLATTTEADRILKTRVVADMLDIITPPEWMEPEPTVDVRHRGRVGSMRVILDEWDPR